MASKSKWLKNNCSSSRPLLSPTYACPSEKILRFKSHCHRRERGSLHFVNHERKGIKERKWVLPSRKSMARFAAQLGCELMEAGDLKTTNMFNETTVHGVSARNRALVIKLTASPLLSFLLVLMNGISHLPTPTTTCIMRHSALLIMIIVWPDSSREFPPLDDTDIQRTRRSTTRTRYVLNAFLALHIISNAKPPCLSRPRIHPLSSKPS
jgi:hypothetical protein